MVLLFQDTLRKLGNLIVKAVLGIVSKFRLQYLANLSELINVYPHEIPPSVLMIPGRIKIDPLKFP